MSGIEAETDIWSRQRHAPTATVYEAPIKLDVRPNGPQVMMEDGECKEESLRYTAVRPGNATIDG